VGAGDNHSLAIASDGSLWVWGRNDIGQLGFRSTVFRRWTAGGPGETRPVQLGSDSDWAAVAGGMLSSFALKRDGSLWAWGGNWTGQLGDGGPGPLGEFKFPLETLPQSPRPRRIGQDTNWAAISAGAEHVLALKRDGTLWAWGANGCGQLGLGTFSPTNRPTQIGRDRDWALAAAGGVGQSGAHSAGLKRDGSLWVWGNWRNLRLPKSGPNPADTNLVSRPMRFGQSSDWTAVACGSGLGAAVKSNGTLSLWGTGTSGRMPGVALANIGAAPSRLGEDHDWLTVVLDGAGLGGECTMHGLKSDGSLWSWDPQIKPAPGMSQRSPGGGSSPRQILLLGKPQPAATALHP
jgi:alpha-tubulin suppressor-like RCC1 family protein